MIDSSDVQRLDELYCDVLKPALLAEELAQSVFLFLANKKDLENTISMEELVTVLNLKCMQHTWSKLMIYVSINRDKVKARLKTDQRYIAPTKK